MHTCTQHLEYRRDPRRHLAEGIPHAELLRPQRALHGSQEGVDDGGAAQEARHEERYVRGGMYECAEGEAVDDDGEGQRAEGEGRDGKETEGDDGQGFSPI
jgi:hypothetical protein